MCITRIVSETPQILPQVLLSGDIHTPDFHVFGWRSDRVGSHPNVLGKIRRAQMEFGWRCITHTHSSRNTQSLFSQKRHVCNIIALHISIIVPEIHPCVQRAKYQNRHKYCHKRCCQAIYARQIPMYFAGGRTSSAASPMFWGKSVGLKWSLGGVASHIEVPWSSLCPQPLGS